MTGDVQQPRDGADALRKRLRQALSARLLVQSLSIGLPVTGFALLAVRLLAPNTPRLWLLAGLAAALAVCWAAGRFLAVRRTPSRAQCLAAIDASSRGGGLLMAGEAARRAGWHSDAAGIAVPEVAYRPGRALWPPLLMLLFVLAVWAPPASFFAHAVAPRQENGLRSLLEEEAERLELYREQEVVDDETAERIADWLEIADKENERSAGELLEVLDQVTDELDRVAAEAATAADEAHNATLAAEELTDRLSEALDAGALSASQLSSAAEALHEFLEKSGLPSDGQAGLSAESLSNMLSAASSGTLSREMLESLSKGLGECRAASAERLRQLTAADVRKLSQCSGGSCTNGAAALASLLSQNSKGAECAAALATLCSQGGSGGIGKGYAPSELTWQDPASTEGTASKDQSLGRGMLSGEAAPRITGLSASAPHDEGKAVITPGQLGEARGSAGNARTPLVLPRHREAVRRYLGGEK